MKKILVFSLPGLGNTLLFTPVLEKLRKQFPDAKITVLVMYKGSKQMLDGNPNLDELILFEFLKQGNLKSLKFLLELRKRKFDISILPHPSNKAHYNLISFLAGAKLRLGYDYPYLRLKSLSFLQNKRKKLGDNHEIQENFALLESIGLKLTDEQIKNTRLFLKIDNEHRKFADRFYKKYNIKGLKIGIHAGSSTSAGMINKRWPKERFADLANFLIDQYKANILIFGGPDESELKNYIYGLIKNKKKAFLVDIDPIKETVAVIEQCDFFVTNDSGFMHMAVVMNVRTIAISGAVDYKKTYPWNKNSGIIYHDISCYPCYRFGEDLECKRKEKDYACLKYISVYHVANMMEKLKKNEGMGPILERV